MRHDPALLDLLETQSPQPFADTVWRATWATRDPLIGGLGGGRWSPPNELAALYTSLEADGALAETYHHLSRAPVFSSSHLRLHRIAVRVERVVDLGDMDRLAALGLSSEMFRRGETDRSRAIAAAAFFLEFDGLVVPNARWPSRNLVLFTERLPAGALTVVESLDVNWPAWRESQARNRT